MSGSGEYDPGLILPAPFERLRKIGGTFIDFVAPGQQLGERLGQELENQRRYEDEVVIDLRDRVSNIENQDAIRAAMAKHPSNRNI